MIMKYILFIEIKTKYYKKCGSDVIFDFNFMSKYSDLSFRNLNWKLAMVILIQITQFYTQPVILDTFLRFLCS